MNAFDSFSELWANLSRERCLRGARIFRILAGLTLLTEYLVNYGQRRFLFGPNGSFPWDVFMTQARTFSIYRWSTSPLYFEVCFHAGVVAAVLLMLGYVPRLLAPLNYVFWFSLCQRNPYLWDGGDNVMQVILPFACFANLSGEPLALRPDGKGSFGREVAGVVHNAAMLAIGVQISLVYGVAGLMKVQGTSWQSGTALYYALRSSDFRFPGLSERIYASEYVLTFLCYSTVGFQISFPFLVARGGRARLLAVIVAMTFHIGIMVVMGLVTFGLAMMAADLAIVADEEYAFIVAIFGRVREGGLRALRSAGRGLLARRSAVPSRG